MLPAVTNSTETAQLSPSFVEIPNATTGEEFTHLPQYRNFRAMLYRVVGPALRCADALERAATIPSPQQHLEAGLSVQKTLLAFGATGRTWQEWRELIEAAGARYSCLVGTDRCMVEAFFSLLRELSWIIDVMGWQTVLFPVTNDPYSLTLTLLVPPDLFTLTEARRMLPFLRNDADIVARYTTPHKDETQAETGDESEEIWMSAPAIARKYHFDCRKVESILRPFQKETPWHFMLPNRAGNQPKHLYFVPQVLPILKDQMS
jgi:hypothetical protein